MAVSLLAVGDIGAKRDNLASIFDGTRKCLASGDILFGQLETTLTSAGAMSPNARLAMRTDPAFAAVLADTGFDVMSFAGNHCLDWGYEGFDDTLDACAASGIALCGAGSDLANARRPVIKSVNGTTIAFLAYNSILPEGYAAQKHRAGCAPLRAHTFYSQIEPDQPGTDARTLSFCDPADLESLVEDVSRARRGADCVIVSMHWGIHMTEAVIAHYQREGARAAIDAGAAAIIGHHAHILKGIEFYRGAPIFYSLGNFAIEQPHVWDSSITQTDSFRHLASLNPGFDPARHYMLPEDTRYTGVAELVLDHGQAASIRFHPALIDDDSVPRSLAPGFPGFEEVRAYLQKISDQAGCQTEMRVDNDAIVILDRKTPLI